MPTAQFKHANSPSEIAKREAREASGAAPERPRGFRHYNHPDEVAKREGRVVPYADSLPVVVETTGVELPSPAAAVAAHGESSMRVEEPESRLAELEARVIELEDSLDDRWETLLERLFGGPDDVAALRVALANYPALVEGHQALAARLNALANATGVVFNEKPASELSAEASAASDEAARRVAQG